MHSVLPVIFSTILSIVSNSAIAQNICDNAAPVFIENFGSGTTPTSHPDIVTSSLTYQAIGDLNSDGVYRIVNNTQQKAGWHNAADHTGNPDGKMLVMNGNGNTFYRHTINNPLGFQPGYYSMNMYFMNLNSTNNCASPVVPSISFLLEYQATDNSWIAVGGSTVSAPVIATPTWIQLRSVFALSTSQAANIQNIRISIYDGTSPVCGNDFAIDDIGLSVCSSSGPLPVNFVNVSAMQKGNAIAVNWSTASEENNKYFDVEKSINGGANWQPVSTIKATGNNSGTKNYTALDSKPVTGLNYYRVKQVDYDGNFKFSSIVHEKFAIDKTTAFVLTNPIINNIEINIFTSRSQQMSVSLFDMSGKLVASDKWKVAGGASVMKLDKAKNIQKGIYILNIKDETGNSIYNGKLLRD